MVAACTPPSERLYDKAYKAIEKNQFRIGVDLLLRAANVEKKENLKFRDMMEAARIVRFEIQDYPRAIRIYRKIILDSLDEPTRINSQELIAEIYFENIQNYEMAAKELQVLEPLVKNEVRHEKIALRLCQAFYLTGRYEDALEEADAQLRAPKIEELSFMKIKAQILTAQKKYSDALDLYQKILDKNEIYFENENLFIAVSVVYEENEQYSEAMKYLKKYESEIKDKNYLELRYKKLQERLVNQPLFKGRRK